MLYDPAHPIALPADRRVQRAVLQASPFSLAQQWRAPRLLRQIGADLYHSAYVLMPYRPGIPTLLTVYDLIPLRYPRHSTARARLLARWMTRLALRTARCAAAISEFTRADFMQEFRLPPERITAIPLAADPVFRPQPAEALAAVRRRHNLPETFALYLGSNKPHKNLVQLVRAWGAACDAGRVHAGQLVIGGAWDARHPEARNLAETLTTVRWLGPVAETDLPALYGAAAAFVFPSLYEGFGLPVLEAMACGTPVICSNTSSLPEVTAAEGGPAALLIDPLDMAGLADALGRVLSEPELAATLRARGLAQAARFSWEKTAAQTLGLYREMLS